MGMRDQISNFKTISCRRAESCNRSKTDSHRHENDNNMARIAFFLCLIASSAAENAPSSFSSACSSTPRLLKFMAPPPPLTCTQSSSQLGDSIRSPTATSRFFHSLDTDDSGIISPDEMALFLKDRIGGSQFSNSENIIQEVGQVMKQLDMNHDNGLEMADVEGYWSRLESLLTAEEVSEWVVYAVQLPAEVGRIFLQNGITGYDFPEIVQNSGSALQEELGLKSSFRSKIVRGVQARMLGIGSTPERVVADFNLATCRSVSLKWSKPQARVFPVHSYRIQKRDINLFEANESSSDSGSLSMSISYENSPVLSPASSWQTIYIGGETEYVDSTLELGHNYMYRIQAWNSVGRGPWEVVDLERVLRKKGCSTRPSKKRNSDSMMTISMRGMPPAGDEESWEWLSFPQRLAWSIVFAIQFCYHSARAFFMVIAMGGAIMRIRRASASSSASATAALPFPWFWKGINRLSVKLTGHECIPRTMLGDREALMLQEKMHDDRMMTTGLRGYSRINQKKEEYNGNAARGNGKNEVAFADKAKNRIDRRVCMANSKAFSTGNLNQHRESTMPPREVVVSKGITPNMFTWKRNSKSSLQKSSESSGALSSDNESTTLSPVKEIKSPQIIDDGSLCVACHKKFKFGKRYKHHCSRCMATFCHKHGKTTHSNLTSCKVPGSCLCNPCLEVVSGRSHILAERTVSVGF
ncbi:hypothetical protein HJC23_012651 [Cyclotella cryptica]|uniref:Calmodulin n=1 Tax=Cyclotella cryptica TaxID=29204 RepID=A0ABD3QPD5_9STRA|eukprot:CCRYP_004196-RA/>CCRYP_004196-RA protein AED:0.00 eAED:0.00 QI:174/-1/1/1/-1/1/1/213/696